MNSRRQNHSQEHAHEGGEQGRRERREALGRAGRVGEGKEAGNRAAGMNDKNVKSLSVAQDCPHCLLIAHSCSHPVALTILSLAHKLERRCAHACGSGANVLSAVLGLPVCLGGPRTWP